MRMRARARPICCVGSVLLLDVSCCEVMARDEALCWIVLGSVASHWVVLYGTSRCIKSRRVMCDAVARRMGRTYKWMFSRSLMKTMDFASIASTVWWILKGSLRIGRLRAGSPRLWRRGGGGVVRYAYRTAWQYVTHPHARMRARGS